MQEAKVSSKRLERIQRKKKKLAALIEISELNNKDREELQFSPKSGPGGDCLRETDMSDMKKKTADSTSDKSSCEMVAGEKEIGLSSTYSEDLSETMCEGTGSHRKKKKRKHRHPKDIEDSDSRRKHKSATEDEQSERDEFPILVTETKSEVFNVKKRKSATELEVPKERPIKILKRQSEQYFPQPLHARLQATPSFDDELDSFRKDMERSKHDKERKERKKFAKIEETTEKDVQDVKNSQEPMNGVDEIEELRKMLRARKKQLKEIPYIRLKGAGKEADLEILDQRIPILPGDVQNFLMLSQLGYDCPKVPRWIELKKLDRVCKTVVLVVEGASAYDFFSQEASCPTLHSMDIKAEMISPYCYNANIVEELCAVPLTRQMKKNLEKRFGKEICPEALMTNKLIKVLKTAFSIYLVPKGNTEAVEQKIAVPATDKFPRTELLLSAWQLIEEGYPLPYGSSELGNRYPDYVMTKEEYAEVTPSSPMWALDCEMCLTRAGNELTRVSVVNEQHETVYESFCLPRNPIINYLTEFSGITAKMLKGVTTRLEDVQKHLRELFPPDVILVGQSLNADLHSLKMMHPYVIDTSVIFNLTGVRRRKTKLAKLTEEFLNESIQQRGAEGHDSVEDSLAALKLVQHKLTKSIEYGDAVLSELKDDMTPVNASLDDSYQEHSAKDFDDLKVEVGPSMATSLFKHITMRKKRVCLIGQEETLAEYSTFVAAAHKENKQLIGTLTTENNTETIAKACAECKNNSFTLAHTVLSEEEDITLVDSWMKKLYDAPPFNSLFIVVLVGSHQSFANGAVLAKVKKPNLRLKPRKTD